MGFQQVPPAAISRVLASFDREQLAGFVCVAIDLIDLVDGDADIELNGDEADGSPAEDEFMSHEGNGPGCPVSDAGEESDPAELNGDEGDYGGEVDGI